MMLAAVTALSAATLLLAGAGCAGRGATAIASSPDARAGAAPIGEATMLDDGTLVLDLTAVTGATRGHTRLTYPPGDPRALDVLRHLGGLKPGERKPVPPWPDTIDDLRVQHAVEAWAKGRGWSPGEYRHEITGTDADGNVAVSVHRTAPAGDSAALRLDPGDYRVVKELPLK